MSRKIVINLLKNKRSGCQYKGLLYVMVPFLLLSACDSKKTSNPIGTIIDSNKSSYDAMPDSVVNYINSAIDTMRKCSFRRDSINWKKLRKRTFESAKGATTYSETYSAIKEALVLLKDNHSFFRTPEQYHQWRGAQKEQFAQIELPKGKMLDNGFAYIILNSFVSGDPKQGLEYATKLQNLIRFLDSQNPRGWIIDLIPNYGGNMWPMLAGIGPLVGEGVLGNFVEVDGSSTPWIYENGEARMGKEIMMKVPKAYQVKNMDVPVAILVGDRTASSGEAILISFMNRNNTKVFGTPTCGLTTANESYSLVDSAQIILTTAVFADREGYRYGKQIAPDVDLSKEWYFISGHKHYTTIKAAKKWISEEKKLIRNPTE